MMRDMIAQLAKRIGWVTWYHVTYQFPVPGGTCTGDAVVSVRPWLRQGKNFEELRESLHEQAEDHGCTTMPNITSITRIGA